MLCKIKLDPDDLKKYVQLCSKKTNFANQNLAGLIKHEHEMDIQKYGEIIKSLCKYFL